jgi:hypothetical protein
MVNSRGGIKEKKNPRISFFLNSSWGFIDSIAEFAAMAGDSGNQSELVLYA